jgi:uncharacterized membrane protein YqjE
MNDQLKESALIRALSNVAGDLADLFQKEIHLAKTELADNIARKARAGLWLSIAAGFGLLAAIVLVEAAIFAIASYGIALHWSCVIAAAVLVALGAGAYAKSRADARAELTPRRAAHQVQQDLATVKEQFS